MDIYDHLTATLAGKVLFWTFSHSFWVSNKEEDIYTTVNVK